MKRPLLVMVSMVLLAACHEEPPIVIKFEPVDAGARAAATAGADGGARAAATAVPPASPGADTPVAAGRPPDGGSIAVGVKAGARKQECKVASDCEVASVECCDCANGGKQEAMPKAKAAQLKAHHGEKCKGVMCTMMVATDPTCGKRADCVTGVCTMVEKKK